MDLVPLDGGRTRLRLRVRPAGRKNAILGEHGGALRVSVTAPPEKGKANRAVAALLADALGIAAGSVEIVSGETSHDKVVVLPLPADEILNRLLDRGALG